jgi:spore maturation protein SpmB
MAIVRFVFLPLLTVVSVQATGEVANPLLSMMSGSAAMSAADQLKQVESSGLSAAVAAAMQGAPDDTQAQVQMSDNAVRDI